MKKISELIFAVTLIAFLQGGFAQNLYEPRNGKITWQQCDSMAMISAFKRDTISALEYYRHALELDPGNERMKKSYERLSNLYAKSAQSFYNINR